MLSGTAPALACIAQPLAYSLNEAWPAPNAVAPLDTPLVLPQEDLPVDAPWSGNSYPSSMPLREQATGEIVLGSWVDHGPLSADGLLSFVHQAPLKPNTVYTVDLGDVRVGAASDPQQTTWTFATGDANALPLRLEGELSVSYELGSDPVYDCSHEGICGGCVLTGERAVTKARVALPAPADGYSAQGYWGTLTVGEALETAGTERVWLRYGVTASTAPATEARVTVPERKDGASYPPCFTYELRDASGATATTHLCLPDDYPQLTAQGDDATAPQGAHTSTACNLSGAPRSSVWPFALAALWLSRRRRSKSASAPSKASRQNVNLLAADN